MGTTTNLIFIVLLSFFTCITNSHGALSNQVGSSTTLIGQNLLMTGFQQNYAESQTQHPALLAHIKGNHHSVYTFYSHFNFSQAGNITVQNNATTGVSAQNGSFDPNPHNQFMMSYHFSTELGLAWYAQSFGFSFVAPLPELMVIDTTSSFLPKYYWYDSKLNKTEILLHLAQKFNDHWSSSLTMNSSWDLVGQSEMTAGLTGGTSSSGRIQAKLKPTIYPHFAIAYQADKYNFHLSWNPTSKQTLENQVIGKAPIGGSSNVEYTFRMIAQNHFEPMQSKADFTLKYNHQWHALLGLTYQDWSKFESNRLEITDANGVISNGQRFEDLKGRSIFSPALGMEHLAESGSITALSYRYRPKIFDKDNSQNGNTLDQNTHILGFAYKSTVIGSVIWSVGIQHHFLKKESTFKSANQEDGTSGNKIGAPGYTMGGSYTIFAAGLNYSF